MTPVEDGKADFIQDRHDVYRDQWDRILQWGKQTGLNPACHMGEWTFMAQEQVRVSGWKMNNRKHGGGGGLLARPTQQDSCCRQARWSEVTWGSGGRVRSLIRF